MSMRRSARLMLMVAALAIVPMAMAQDAAKPAAPATQPAGVSGNYVMAIQGPQGDMEFTFKLQQDGDKLTGTFSGFGDDTPIADGKVGKNGEISFKVVRDFGGQQMVTSYTCKLADGTLKGKSEMKMVRDFEAKKSQ